LRIVKALPQLRSGQGNRKLLSRAERPVGVALEDENELRYAALRRLAREFVAHKINEKNQRVGAGGQWKGVVLASICEEALEAARKEWPKYYGDETHEGFLYSWERLFYKFGCRPSFFNLAIWQECDGERHLQAMALGKPSRAKTHLTLHWVERSFAPTALKGVLPAILACAEEYAKLLKSERVLIKDAVDNAVYEKYGYAPYDLRKVSGSYLSKEV
jgi:hypothetical protein